MEFINLDDIDPQTSEPRSQNSHDVENKDIPYIQDSMRSTNKLLLVDNIEPECCIADKEDWTIDQLQAVLLMKYNLEQVRNR